MTILHKLCKTIAAWFFGEPIIEEDYNYETRLITIIHMGSQQFRIGEWND